MKILITGSNGFIGENLISQLNNIQQGKTKHPLNGLIEIFEYDQHTSKLDLERYTKECEFVIHLAGVNRPKNEEDFMNGNFGFTSELLALLKKHHNQSPILITSSIQALLDNPYGQSKKSGEDLMFAYGQENHIKTLVYRLPNVFGKWCRPNYNSAVATFCHNIAHGLDIMVNDPNVCMQLVYIDDVVNEFIDALIAKEHIANGFGFIPTVHRVTLGEIVEHLYRFKDNRATLDVPNLRNEFEKVLYSTYLSYLPKESFSYSVKMKEDDRGSFTELIKTIDKGQFSVNITKPQITKGNHWHHSKNEKFVVVSGEAMIRFRKIGCDEIIEYHVSGKNIEVVDIPCGYTHNITNIGKEDLITFIWCNEIFDENHPDTYFEVV
ncbi:MAG: NAD-dependent epimerase/dehydratase family protein [Erysipelotrichaceae bacterium]